MSIATHVVEHVAVSRGFVRGMVDLACSGGLVAIVSEDVLIRQYDWDRVPAKLLGRVPPSRSSTGQVFRSVHLRTLLSEAGCDAVRTRSFICRPPHESLHWRAYEGFLRMVDGLVERAEYLLFVGHRSLAP